MTNKEINLKEKFRLALSSTAKVISDDFSINDKFSKNKKSEDSNIIEIENLSNPSDFIRLRAETDSAAFQMNLFIKKICQTILLQNYFIILLKKLDMSC